MSGWTHVCQRKTYILDSLNQGPPMAVRFFIFQHDADTPTMEGIVDWQDGVSIYHAECIDPSEWSAMSACVLEALKEAREMLCETSGTNTRDPA